MNRVSPPVHAYRYEEDRLLRIRKDFGGGNVQLAYEYAYGYDGGRRWRKDYAANQWTWYPCGVACSAGELVESQSDLNGINWTTTAQYLKPGGCGGAVVRRNSEFHLWDITGTAQAIVDSNTAILANDLYDSFGVKRFTSGSAVTQYRSTVWYAEAEGLEAAAGCYVIANRAADALLGCFIKNKKPALPKECDEKKTRVNCEECLSALFQTCLKQLSTLECSTRLRGCQLLCTDGERKNIGAAVYNCFTFRWPK